MILSGTLVNVDAAAGSLLGRYLGHFMAIVTDIAATNPRRDRLHARRANQSGGISR